MLCIVKEEIKIEVVNISKYSEKQLMRITPLRNSTTFINNISFINNTVCDSIQEACYAMSMGGIYWKSYLGLRS